MVLRLLFFLKFRLSICLSILFVIIISLESNAQCAGNDNSTTVCDISNVASQTIDLNALLGVYTTGGNWNDDDDSGGLNETTGILNAQQVSKSGVYHYTYSVNDIAGCTDEAVITVTIGGYSGISGPNNSICSSDQSYSLFQVFQGTPVLAPQSGGLWHDDNNSGGLNPMTGILNASVPIPGRNYAFTYTIPAIDVCAEVSSQLSVSIYRSPEPGTRSNLALCSNVLGSYTNLNLNDRLTGEDAGGVWSESNSSEISDSTDSTVDLQNIFNTRGSGDYRFTYTVYPPKDDRVCAERSTTVLISIGEQLDFTGATLVVNPDGVCENSMASTTYTGILTQGTKAIANGNYKVTYTISGIGTFTTTQSFSNGVLIFPIPASNFSQVQNYTISINEVTLTTNPVVCSSIIGTIEDILHINPSPKIDNATLAVAPVCQGGDALVGFSGISNLTDGDYDIIYRLSGSNILSGIPATMSVLNGVSSFSIPAAYIPRTGTTTITITRIINLSTGCASTSTLKTDFTVNSSLDLNSLQIGVNNICQNQPAIVTLTGLESFTAIDVSYYISGSNTISPKIISLTASSGQGDFIIPATDIPNAGLNTITISNITNTLTGCIFTTNNKSANFTVISSPSIPVAADEQPFCVSDNSTVANLTPQGSQYQWFDSDTSTVPLPVETPLRSGAYFVKETSTTTGCSSNLKMINATIYSNPQIDTARLSIATTCQSYNVTVLLGGNSNLTNGKYTILYDLSGDNIGVGITAELTVTNGIGFFPIPSTTAPNAGTTTVSITNIRNSTTGCSNLANLSQSFTTNPAPDISNLVVTINDVCQGQPTNVVLSGLSGLTTININFQLLGANSVALKTIPLNVVAGTVSFQIPATDIPNSGLTTFNLTNITNTVTGCPIFIDQRNNFAVNALPNVSNIIVTVNNGCLNQHLNVSVSGLGTLTDVVLSYSLTGVNTTIGQTPSLSVVGGNANFEIPSTELTATGTSTLSIENISNSVTGCSSIISSNSQNFDILPIPNAPTADNQEFCKENLATVASLIPNGAQYNWYDSVDATAPLQQNTLLTTGNYYLRETNSTTSCESDATVVSVVINSVPIPILNSNGQDFCGADKPTIQSLSNNTTYVGTLTWYDSPTNGITLTTADLLVEGTTYYGIDYNTNTNCVSEPLEAMVTLLACNVTPDGLFIPDAFSPNGDGVNDTFFIKDIEFLFPNFTLEIFNRYGNVIFKGNINKPDWDGKNSNSSFIDGDAATGVYFYIINYNKDNLKPRQGQLYLNR